MSTSSTNQEGAVSVNMSINPDLAKERTTATFDQSKLTYLLDGGAESTKRRKEIAHILFSEPLFCQDNYNMGKQEAYELATRKTVRLLELAKKHGWSYDDMCRCCMCIKYDTSLWLQVIMFIPSLERLTTDEQRRKWLPLALSGHIFGTYVQTELGHGTNLQGLETTAVYEPSTQEFVLNTPTLTSMKWWPGNLARTCTHAIVLANLVCGGKPCGMQPFMVQLRDLENHKLRPGITTGDIGPKMAANQIDNGFLILRNARIPRENMLMRFSEVSTDGVFTKKGSSKANYAIMTSVRVDFVHKSYLSLATCATVVIRYSAVRRQSYIQPGAGEVQILDFQTQQYRLFNPLSQAFAFFFANQKLQKLQEVFQEEAAAGNFRLLSVMHCMSSCLKAFCTDAAAHDLEQCRRACGGHGYLLASGLPSMVNMFLSAVTVEGENTVLYLQTARILLKSYSDILNGKECHPAIMYLGDNDIDTSKLTSQQCLEAKWIIKAYRLRSKRLLQSGATMLQQRILEGKPHHIAWNECGVDLTVAARAHAHLSVVQSFVEGIQTIGDRDIKRVLSMLCDLYMFHGIVLYSGEFLKTGAVTADQLTAFEMEEKRLLPLIRPEAVRLVDSFDFHDKTLSSAIGCYDGNAYQNLYDTTKQNPMNQTEIHESYYKYLKPWFQKARL